MFGRCCLSRPPVSRHVVGVGANWRAPCSIHIGPSCITCVDRGRNGARSMAGSAGRCRNETVNRPYGRRGLEERIFNRFAAFHDFWRHGPAPAHSFDTNDRAGHRLPTRAGSPHRLACCCRQNRETSRLECRWKLAIWRDRYGRMSSAKARSSVAADAIPFNVASARMAPAARRT
jgi:hypothetical protein